MYTFYRWVPKAFADTAVTSGLISHNTSAMWIVDIKGGNYRPGMSSGAVLIAYDVDDTAADNIRTVGLLNFEEDTFLGEAQHPDKVIVKNNEIGAYGLGKTRQQICNMHCKTRLAKEAEVRKALGASKKDDISGYKPKSGWPT